MKFTVERATLVKMLELVGRKAPTQKRRDKQVRLSACAARVFVEANQSTAGIEALVFADGRCVLAHDTFLKLLKSYAPKPNVTMDADERAIRFFSTTLPATSYSAAVTPPGTFKVFPVTDLNVLLPNKPALEKDAENLPLQTMSSTEPPSKDHLQNQLAAQGVAENPPVFASGMEAQASICKQEGSFPMAEDEMHLVEELVRLTRRLCALPTIKPQHLAGLAHALFAFEQLPRITKGVEVEFSVGIRWGTEHDHTENSATLHISENCFNIGSMLCTRDPQVGGDHHTRVIYEVESGGFRSMVAGDEEAWAPIFDWITHLDALLEENSPEELRLFVSDDSKHDFMATGDEK